MMKYMGGGAKEYYISSLTDPNIPSDAKHRSFLSSECSHPEKAAEKLKFFLFANVEKSAKQIWWSVVPEIRFFLDIATDRPKYTSYTSFFYSEKEIA